MAKPYAGLVVIISDTYINGRHVRAGTCEKVDQNAFSLLSEANRCEIFDGEKPEHQEALARTKKEEAARAKAAADAEKKSDGDKK